MNERYSPPERHPLNEAQVAALEEICDRYGVRYSPDDYYVFPPESTFTPLWAEGWVGGSEQAGKTIYIGVSPEGERHS